MEDSIDEMGPIDYLVIEWSGGAQPNGEAAPILLDLAERGIIRVLDFALIAKDEDGNVAAVEISEHADDAGLAEFEGAASGLLDDEDIVEAGSALEPGSVAALLIYENRWAAPFAVALRRSGAHMVAQGRVPTQELVAALEALEAA
jgi:Family of unknown function (DUF6325)